MFVLLKQEKEKEIKKLKEDNDRLYFENFLHKASNVLSTMPENGNDILTDSASTNSTLSPSSDGPSHSQITTPQKMDGLKK